MNRNRRPSSEALWLLGSNLKRLREARGYSQIELGRRSGVDNNQISKIEQEQGNASLALLDALARGLDCSLQTCSCQSENPRARCSVKRKRNTDILWRIGMNVRRLRKARGYTQVQLARRSGVSKAYVSKVEQEVLNSGIVHLEALAIGLECSLEDLTMRPPEQPEPVPCPGSILSCCSGR